VSNILTACVTIKGTRPLLWHWFGPDAIPLEKGERTGVAGNDPAEWRQTVTYLPDTRQLYLDPSQVFACVRDGSKNVKEGRGSIQAKVTSTLQVVDDLVLIDRYLPVEPMPTDRTEPVYIDRRGVVNPATRGRNVRYRVAASAGWSASFRLLWDRTVVSREKMEAAIRDAGTLAGIGSGRKIGMGRFELVGFEVA